jgi:hypothetical protein
MTADPAMPAILREFLLQQNIIRTPAPASLPERLTVINNVIPLSNQNFSDAQLRDPPSDGYKLEDVSYFYLITLWESEARRRDLPPGLYMLDSLPAGYRSFTRRSRTDNRLHRFLYGHQNGPFNSAVQYRTHFKYTQIHSTDVGCSCKVCQ